MSKTGKFRVETPDGRVFEIEPISVYAERSAKDLSNKPHPDDSTISDKNILILGPGESPHSAIQQIIENDKTN